MARKQRPPETINGAIGAIPHVVLDSLAFTGASDKAKALIFAFMRQLNGRNNGHLHLAPQWLKRQGFTSSSNYKARDELLARSLIIQTRHGGLNMGTNCFAVTWLAISNFVGLDIARPIISEVNGLYVNCHPRLDGLSLSIKNATSTTMTVAVQLRLP